MDGIIVLFTSLVVVLFGLSLRAYYVYINKKRDLQEEVNESVRMELWLEKKKTRKEKYLERIFKFADDFTDLGQRVNFFSEDEEVKKYLIQAGSPYGLSVMRFQGLKMFMLIVGFFVGAVLLVLQFPLSQFMVILLPVFGYGGTILWLRSKAKKRQDEISYQLPDFLDTMSVTLQAGVGMDQALRDIVHYFEGPVKEEFGRFIQELNVGVPRTEAYKSLLARNESKEFQILIKSLIQAERLGVPIADTFKQQAEEMRKLKKEMIKEKAAKASPKVTLVTTFLILPSALVLIGGLMIINIFTENKGIFELFN